MPWYLISMWWEDQSTLVKVLVVAGILAFIGSLVYRQVLVAELDRDADVSWDATVSTARGNSLQPGDRCAVVASLGGNGEEDFALSYLAVRCGAENLYNWNDPAILISGDDAPRPHRECTELGQQVGSNGPTYSLRCSDTGGRTGGRPELGLDTPNGTVSVWRDTPPMFRVELDIEPWSQPTKALPLLGGARGRPAWYD